jgi:hypothetical protein
LQAFEATCIAAARNQASEEEVDNALMRLDSALLSLLATVPHTLLA